MFLVDPVYMPNDSWKDEYVLNEDGMQFFGSSFRIGHMDWYFGQVGEKENVKTLSSYRLRCIGPWYEHFVVVFSVLLQCS